MKGKWKIFILIVAVVVAGTLSGISAVVFLSNQEPVMLTPSRITYSNPTMNDSESHPHTPTGCYPVPHPGQVWLPNPHWTKPA